MKFARTVAALGASLTVAACVAQPPAAPAVTVLPGKNKDAAAFQQDQTICEQHAVAHTGYGTPSNSPVRPPAVAQAAPATPANAQIAPAAPPDQAAYVQCMAARGDTVQIASPVAGDSGYAYAYPYAPGYPYPYAGPYPYAYPYDGFYGGWYGGGWGWGRGGWGHGAWNRGGLGRGGLGRGGWGRGGWARGAGSHGGGSHGGGHR